AREAPLTAISLPDRLGVACLSGKELAAPRAGFPPAGVGCRRNTRRGAQGWTRRRTLRQNPGRMSFFWIIQIVSVVGVLAVIALTWAVGWGRRTKIATLDAAEQRLRADFPGTEVMDGTLGADGQAAILALANGYIGLVVTLGDELVTRKL